MVLKTTSGTAAGEVSSYVEVQAKHGADRGGGGGRKIGKSEESLLPWCAESI
jgi:hypothetical protein